MEKSKMEMLLDYAMSTISSAINMQENGILDRHETYKYFKILNEQVGKLFEEQSKSYMEYCEKTYHPAELKEMNITIVKGRPLYDFSVVKYQPYIDKLAEKKRLDKEIKDIEKLLIQNRENQFMYDSKSGELLDSPEIKGYSKDYIKVL